MTPEQPITTGVAPITVAPITTTAPAITPDVVVKEIEKVVSEIRKDYKQPAFWVHLAVQIATWYGFFSVGSNSVKIGTLTLSGVALVTYLSHLTIVKKYL